MESDGSFVAVANTCIPIIIRQIFDDELLTDVNDFMNVFTDQVDELNGELA